MSASKLTAEAVANEAISLALTAPTPEGRAQSLLNTLQLLPQGRQEEAIKEAYKAISEIKGDTQEVIARKTQLLSQVVANLTRLEQLEAASQSR